MITKNELGKRGFREKMKGHPLWWFGPLIRLGKDNLVRAILGLLVGVVGGGGWSGQEKTQIDAKACGEELSD